MGAIKMKTMITSVVMVLLVLPSMLFAATNCKVTEYPDHFEAVCIGDEQSGPLQKQGPAQTPRVNVTSPDKTQSAEAVKSTDEPQSDKMIQSSDMGTIVVPGKTAVKDQAQASSQRTLVPPQQTLAP